MPGYILDMSNADLRKKLRVARKALLPAEREQKSLAVTQHLSRLIVFRQSRHVAAYWSTPEEVDTTSIMEFAVRLEKRVYLPVINTASWRAAPMYFEGYTPGVTTFRDNRYGIPEPVHRPGTPVQARDMDLILVPLVGFNEHCDRIGMGGGFYDRCLAQTGYRNTRFIGLAFDCQRAEFQPEPHDIQMHAIVTESGVLSPS